MGDEPRFSEKWDFRRKENSFNDSSSDDDPDSNSTQDPIIRNPNLALDPNQIDDGTKTVAREEPVKTRKRRSTKDESKPEKPKQVRGRKPKTVCPEENTKKEETVMGIDGVGTFMETLLDDLTASRESLMDWMKTELYGSSDQNVVSQPPLRKRGVGAVAAHRPVKKRMTKKKKEEEEKKKKEEEEKKKKEEEEKKKESEKQSTPDKSGQEMNTATEKSSAIAQNGGDLDCNAGPLDMFLVSGQGDLGRNYFQQQEEVQEGQTEMENSKNNETVKSQKSIVLAIKAPNGPNLSNKQKKTSEANSNKNRSSMVERTGPEAEKAHGFLTPFAPILSSSPSLQSFPVPSSLFPKLPSSSLLQSFPVPSSFFPSSSQGITSLANNTNFQLRQPVAQIPDLSEFQTGEIGGQGFGSSLFPNNGYFSGFPAAFQPNLLAGGYNFPAQMNLATSSQQRDDNNMFGGLRMAGGTIRFSGNRFPEAEVGISNDGFSNYRASSDIDKNACSRDKSNNYLYVP